MKGIYYQKRSPYYWLRFYDSMDKNPDINKRRKSINTKIEITEADWKRIREAEKQRAEGKKVKLKLQGTPQLRELVERFRLGMAERKIKAVTGIDIGRRLLLSEGLKEYIASRTVPGSDDFLRPKSVQSYNQAVEHFIKAVEDKSINKYTKKDFTDLLFYFEDLQIPVGYTEIVEETGRTGRKKKVKVRKYKYRKMSINSRSIYTRNLSALWNYFVNERLAGENIITTIDPEEDDPDPIDLKDMYKILMYLKRDKEYVHHFHIIYFMLLTGARPSSAVVQLKEHIDHPYKFIKIRNVKAGHKKKSKKDFFDFPLYKELFELLTIEMKVKDGDTGRLFPQFKYDDYAYTNSLRFWDRAIDYLLREKLIKRSYMLKQIRPTTANFLIDILGQDIYTVQKLLDHANIKITDKHYVRHNLKKTRKQLDVFKLEDLLSDDHLD